MPRLVPLVLLGACYANPSPIVARPTLPPLQDGQLIEVETDVRVENHRVGERICIDHDTECHTVKISEPIKVRHASATYGGTKLTLGQVEGLSEPKVLTVVDEMNAHTKKCKHASIPKIVGEVFGLVGALLIVSAYSQSGESADKTKLTVGIGLVGAGIGSYALGNWVFFGKHCDQAAAIYNKYEGEFREFDDTDASFGNAKIMEDAAKRFNAKQGTTEPKPSTEETSP